MKFYSLDNPKLLTILPGNHVATKFIILSKSKSFSLSCFNLFFEKR